MKPMMIQDIGCVVMASGLSARYGRNKLLEDLDGKAVIVRVVDSYGDKTAIGTLDTRTGEISTGDWYSLDGRRLQGKPSTKGIYIHSGRKEVLK